MVNIFQQEFQLLLGLLQYLEVAAQVEGRVSPAIVGLKIRDKGAHIPLRVPHSVGPAWREAQQAAHKAPHPVCDRADSSNIVQISSKI